MTDGKDEKGGIHMISAILSTIGVVIGLALICLVVVVCLGKGAVDIIAYVVGKISAAARKGKN